MSGKVKCVLPPKLLINTCRPGDSFGEMALLSDQERSFTALATEKTQLYFLSKEDFEQLLIQDLGLMRVFVKSISRRLAEISRELTPQEDDTGMLTGSFNEMTQGLRERELLKQAIANAGFQLVETRGSDGQISSYQLQPSST